MDCKDLGNRIRILRRQKGLSQEELSELLNISPSHLGHLERGTRVPSLEIFALLCNVLKTSPDFLLKGSLSGDITMPADLSEEQREKLNSLAICAYELWIK